MSYENALTAAGATVHAFESFGSYQGDWWAKVTLPDGRHGWIHGSFGSCSGCDAFEAEFGYDDEYCDDHWREIDRAVCPACQTKQAAHQVKLAAFGAEYLDGLLPQEDAEKQAAENLEWDSDAGTMLAFLKTHAPVQTGHQEGQ